MEHQPQQQPTHKPAKQRAMKQSLSVATVMSVSFIQAYLLVNIFPYQAYMSVFLWNRQHIENDAITVEQAGPYAAFLTTSFMIGRTFTAHYWGKLADIYGRRAVLMISLIGSGCACIWFGITSTYFGAVLARGVIGAWNSIVGVTKTLATELAYHDFADGTLLNGGNSDQHKQETRIVGLVMSMRAWGFLIAPAMAGYLADPLMIRVNSSSSNEMHASTLFNELLQSYPYLLPNLLGALLCWLTAAAVFFIVPETLEECKPLGYDVQCKNRFGQRMQQSYTYISGTYGSLEDINNDSDEDNNTNCCWKEEQQSTTSISSIWSRRNTRNHLIAYWLYSFVVIAIDEAFPLYCISRNSGLGQLSESDIGTILSIAGLIFLIDLVFMGH